MARSGPSRARRTGSKGSVSSINGDLTKWRVRVYIPGENGKSRQKTLPGGPWPTKQAAEQALNLFEARRLVAEADGIPVEDLLRPLTTRPAEGPVAFQPVTAEATDDSTAEDRESLPLRVVYIRSLTLKGGQSGMSKDRRSFLATITGEAKTKRGEPITGRLPIAQVPIGEIDPELVERWAVTLKCNPDNPEWNLAPSTVAKWGRHLEQTLKWAKKNRYTSINAMKDLDLNERGEITNSRQPQYVMTLNEVYRLRSSATDAVESLLWDTLAFSGIRQGEARALRPESLVGASTPHLDIQASVSTDTVDGKPTLKPPKTDASIRRVPVPRGLMARLKAHAATIEPGNPLFPSPLSPDRLMRGEWLSRRFRESCNRAGLVGNPLDSMKGRRKAPGAHGLRATAASMLFSAGATVPEVQAFLGHAQPVLTLQVYTEVKDFGTEHPVAVYCRGKGFTVAHILDWMYEGMQAEGILGVAAMRSDDASAFEDYYDTYDVSEMQRDVTKVLIDAALAASPGARAARRGPRGHATSDSGSLPESEGSSASRGEPATSLARHKQSSNKTRDAI